MRRILAFGLLVVIAGLIAGAVFKMNQTLSAKEAIASKLQHRPSLSTAQFIKTAHPPPLMIDGKPTLIILFDPDCEHCQYEAEQLQKHHREFAQANVYLLTT